MKKIITAINNPKLNEELKKEEKFEIIGKDVQYKEAILEILEQNKNIDIIILSEKIPGEIKLEKLIEKIKLINKEIKIIFILEKENNEIEKILMKNNIIDIYYNNKINLNELIEIINKKEINIEEEIIKLKKIIEEKNINYNKKENNIEKQKLKERIFNLNLLYYLKKIKNRIKIRIKKVRKKGKKRDNSGNMSTKIITFSGNYKSGKSILSLVFSQYLAERNYKVLLIDGDLEKQDLEMILRKNKWKNNKNNKYKDNFDKNIKKNPLKIKTTKNKVFKKFKNKKNTIYYYHMKNVINVSIKSINKNLYFFKQLNFLLKNKIIKKEKILEKLIFTFLKSINKNYNFIIIDVSKSNFDTINKLILKNSNINFMCMEANLLGIKEIQNLLKIYLERWKIDKKSLYIISNKNNICSINKNLISNFIFFKNKIFRIKENKIYHIVINNYYKMRFLLKRKNIKKEIDKIIYKTIIKNNKK